MKGSDAFASSAGVDGSAQQGQMTWGTGMQCGHWCLPPAGRAEVWAGPWVLAAGPS